MKFIKDNIVSILMVVIAVVVTLQLSSMFRKSPVNETQVRNDEAMKWQERERVYKDSIYQYNISQKDLQIDSLKLLITNNKQSIVKSNERIKTISANVSNRSIGDLVESTRPR